MFRKFAQVIVPLSLPQLFTYAIPETFFFVSSGCRVVVPFGKNKLYSAVVHSVTDTEPDEKNFEVKEIIEVLDAKPVINSFQLKFWDWIASYYLCSVGEVFRAAVPSAMKLESQTILYRTAKPLDYNELKPKEIFLLEAFTSKVKELELSKAGKFTGLKNNISLIKNLISAGYLVADKIIEEKYKPKTEKFVSLSDLLSEKDRFSVWEELLKKAPKQAEILQFFMKNAAEHSRRELLSPETGFSVAALAALVSKGVLTEEEREVSRLKIYDGDLELCRELSESQNAALKKIETLFLEKNAVLLFGVTGSGKTEIYIRLIDKYLSAGKQVLYLLPEIVLTSQIIRRLQKIFGDNAAIYHSKISEAERAEIWRGVASDEPSSRRLIVGVRSSVFLPFHSLGLVIIDEEHDASYKQSDPQPRYNARDCALVLAGLHGAKTLLGSATPSFESYYNAQTGKYGYVELLSRYGGVQMPETEFVNTRKEQMNSLFSRTLLNKIQNCLDGKKQIILYRNRRGFSPYVECSSCGWIPSCENCDVSLTYHKRENRLVCHHCGYAIDMPHKCLACGDTTLTTKGFGTEKVEDEIKIFFPDAKIARLDADVTSSKSRFEQIVGDFESGQTDILTGTQMISKGFDFQNLALCGILDADSMLFFPDFRAEERTFQQIVQAGGRAGRRNLRGKVLIQTSAPENPVYADVRTGDYKHFYTRLISERSRYAYPPFTRLVKIQVKHKEEPTVNYSSNMLAGLLRKSFGAGVLGPEFPLIARVQNLFVKEIMLKISRQYYGSEAKKSILDAVNYTKSMAVKAGLIISINVDPA